MIESKPIERAVTVGAVFIVAFLCLASPFSADGATVERTSPCSRSRAGGQRCKSGRGEETIPILDQAGWSEDGETREGARTMTERSDWWRERQVVLLQRTRSSEGGRRPSSHEPQGEARTKLRWDLGSHPLRETLSLRPSVATGKTRQSRVGPLQLPDWALVRRATNRYIRQSRRERAASN